MITFFTSLKPMTGLAAIQQANAVGSWLAIPEAEVLCFGPDAPDADARIRHVPDTPSNAFGTPLLDAMFATAQRLAQHDVICYANGDIIFLDGIGRFAQRLARWPRYLVIGRRQNLELNRRLDFGPGWTEALLRLPAQRKRRASNALDYFLFRRGTITAMPAFAIGRPAWDNWMIMDARRRRLPVIDATLAVTAIHQRHGHDHVPARTGRLWEGPEADENRALARADLPGFEPARYTTDCATWIAGRRWFWPGLGPRRLYARWRAARDIARARKRARPVDSDRHL